VGLHTKIAFVFLIREKSQTEALDQFLRTRPSSHVTVLVTHQVNMTALTDIHPASGEAVVVEVRHANTLRVLGTLPLPQSQPYIK
jgi:hypothetical protein